MSEGDAGMPRAGVPASPDLVYVVRPGDDNEELRYSLRSVAANLPHGRVWIVGTVPSWVRNVETIPLKPRPEKWANIRQSLEAVCAHPDVPDTFVVMNDDHFVVEPVDRLPVFHLGPLLDYIANNKTPESNTWRIGVVNSLQILRSWGVEEPLSYEGHVPLPFDKAALRDALERYPRTPRTFLAYPSLFNVAGVGGPGRRAGNCKTKTDDTLSVKLALDMPFLSSDDKSFGDGEIGRHVRAMFPERSPYEPPQVIPRLPKGDVHGQFERFWDFTHGVPIPREGAMRCGNCDTRLMIPRWFKFHTRPRGASIPWRCDVSLKCAGCARLSLHGVALTEEQWKRRRKVVADGQRITAHALQDHIDREGPR